MCGIVGIFSNSEKNKERATLSLEKIVHRGSSNFEIQTFSNESIIGANRLPIQGRINGFQPISNEKETIRAVQNGEIFNYSILKAKLEEKGHTFSTDCDTELWVHLYEEYGIEAVKYIDSEMFTCIIYDTEKQEIYACRDQLGVKPLYYGYHQDGTLHFASEMKQLTQFEDIPEIFEFPMGSYYYNKNFTIYSTIEDNTELGIITDEGTAINTLTDSLVDAVKKRVNTDLPIGVFLSGGVDSSLIMEIATRFHPDVTAIILGKEGSSDYEYALRLCKDRKYKYHIITPDNDYWEQIDEMMYYAETYEPLIIRHAFANDFCSKVAQQLGLKIVLVGEGADELFCGYNEFAYLSDNSITQGVLQLTKDLGRGHLKRVDRLAMRYTVEPRCPFLDKQVIQVALNIANKLKVKKIDHNITTKYILRKVAQQFLPEYITERYKMPFANGAGMGVGNNYKKSDGEIAEYINKQGEFLDILPESIKEKYNITNNYEAYHLIKYCHFGFDKLQYSEERIIVKDILHLLEDSGKKKLLIAEFDYIPLYFPVYYASRLGIYQQHGLDIEFISTKGDYETYFSLVNGTAQIGLSDPLFSMGKPLNNVSAKMFGELVSVNPLVAVTINPNVSLQQVLDLANYTIGSYKKYTTAHTFATYSVGGKEVVSYEKNDILGALVNREIDIAIVLLEDAIEIERVGGRIIHTFKEAYNRFCFTGITTTDMLGEEYDLATRGFLVSIQETIREIKKNPEKAEKDFCEMFSALKNPQKIFAEYFSYWKSDISPDQYDSQNSYAIWKSVYPSLMESFQGGFFQQDFIQSIIAVFTSKKYKKHHPFLEEQLYKTIKKSVETTTPIPLFMFRGCSDKTHYNEADIATLDYLHQIQQSIQELYKPGYTLTVILADEHGLNNNYTIDDIQLYYTSLLPEFEKRGISYVYLSEIYKQYHFIRQEELKEVRKTLPEMRWEEVNIRKQLEEMASKHNNLEDKLYAAQQYYLLRTLEKKMLESYFVGQIFIAYSGNYVQSVYPYLPTLYTFTERKGYSELPWFK